MLAIKTFCPKFHNQWIEVASNNTTAVAYLCNRGRSDAEMTRMVKHVWSALHTSSCTLYMARWVHSVMENQEADALSWFIDTDNWSLHGETVELLQSVLGEWQVDWFTDADNQKAAVFNTWFESPGCQAVDAFAQDWRGWVNLLVPPIPLMGRVLAHLVKCQAVGILVVPHWPGQESWPLLQVTLVLMGSVLEATAHRVEELVGLAWAESTQHCYKHWWSEFKAFATRSGLVALLAGEDMVHCFLAWLDLAG
ncbi:reverse transcriptase [Acanthamoeba castellanii str. Neff]|uniref:Reverse transcriptase n=1 Tax=Acanthamoeba castellanii (strain ATCC 30010 / Neff) TaxID=1257118 RepID=L8HBQ8_ACACF|nr:reverse transcriptase [Acanthamoeba castellanii str. Neff]ELR21846.1 reverse transcriptase [Acanthamoeba castellanii str. Neff]